MRIAINTRFLLNSKMEGFGWYTYEVSKRLVEDHPEHEFIFFFDRPFDERFVFAPNVTPVILSPPARHPFLFIFWFEVAVKRALKKYNADVFFSPDGYLSLGSTIPQVAVIHDLNFHHNPKDLKPLMSWYYNRYFPRFAKKAQEIITVSEYSRQDICTSYSIPESRVHAIWNGASDAFKPLNEADKEQVRDKYTKNKPYILFVGALHPRKNLKRLLSAFERLKSEGAYQDIQLLIVGEELWKNGLGSIELNQATREDIHFTGHIALDELSRITASAMLLAFIPYFEGFGIPLVEAMKCGTPILAGDKTSIPEVAGEAALYCDPFSVDSIYSGLKQLISDPELRSELSQKGLERSKLFDWQNSSNKTWEIILRAANTK